MAPTSSVTTRRNPPQNDYKIGLICVLSIENYAAQKILDDVYEDEGFVYSENDYTYAFGRVGEHNVVMNYPNFGSTGTLEASHIAERMKTTFPWIRLIFLIGIAGGAPSEKHDVRLGDVVVGTKVVPYRFGKQLDDGFETTGDTFGPSKDFSFALTRLKQAQLDGWSLAQDIDSTRNRIGVGSSQFARPAHDRLYASKSRHSPNCKCTNLVLPVTERDQLVRRPIRPEGDLVRMHFGTIASADQVMKSAKERDEIAAKQEYLCFDMESAGMLKTEGSFFIRGIADYADGHKNDVWHGYASLAAALCAKKLLSKITPEKLDRTPRTGSPGQAAEIAKAAAKAVESLLEQQQHSQDNIHELRDSHNIIRKRIDLMAKWKSDAEIKLEQISQNIAAQEQNWQSEADALHGFVMELETSQIELISCLGELLKQVERMDSQADHKYVTREEWLQFKDEMKATTEKVEKMTFSETAGSGVLFASDVMEEVAEFTDNNNVRFASKLAGVTGRHLKQFRIHLGWGRSSNPEEDKNSTGSDMDQKENKKSSKGKKKFWSRSKKGKASAPGRPINSSPGSQNTPIETDHPRISTTSRPDSVGGSSRSSFTLCSPPDQPTRPSDEQPDTTELPSNVGLSQQSTAATGTLSITNFARGPPPPIPPKKPNLTPTPIQSSPASKHLSGPTSNRHLTSTPPIPAVPTSAPPPVPVKPRGPTGPLLGPQKGSPQISNHLSQAHKSPCNLVSN